MGTYTANKELFMPTVGEQGWGTLVNGNFETIDTFLKPITISGSTYTFTGHQTGGSISATSITNSGTLTQTGTSTFTGKINANGGIDGKINVYESGTTSTIIATCDATSQQLIACPSTTSSGTFTVYEGLFRDLLTITQKSSVFNCEFETYTPYVFVGYPGNGGRFPGWNYGALSIYVDGEFIMGGDVQGSFSNIDNGSPTPHPININSVIKIEYTALKATASNQPTWNNYVILKSRVQNFYL